MDSRLPQFYSQVGRLCGRFVALLAFAGMGALAKADIQFDLFPGYGGVIREGCWFPIACEVFHDGPSFRGTIEIRPSAFWRGHTRRISVELPTNTRKRFVIPAFASGTSLTVAGKLLDERGKTLAELELPQSRAASREVPLLGSLSRTFGGRPLLPQIGNNRTGNRLETARLLPEQFPSDAISLEGLTAIYLNSSRALELSPDQVNALQVWVRSGGHLILAAESPQDVKASPWLNELAPMTVESIETIPVGNAFYNWLTDRSPAVDGARPWLMGMKGRLESESLNLFRGRVRDKAMAEAEIPVLTGRLRTGANAIFEVDGHLLMAGKPAGRGQVTLLTFDPEREPFKSWENRSWFWAKMLEIPKPFLTGQPHLNPFSGESMDGVFGAMIDSRQVKKLPVGWLLALLAGYLVVIGPLDQWWLKKINKQILTWITFPLYVVVFSGLIYFIGYKLRAGETEWNEVQVVDVYQRGRLAVMRGTTFGSLYSPANARYQLGGLADQATLRGEHAIGGGGDEKGRLGLTQTDAGFEAEAFVPVWTSQLFVSDWVKEAEPPMTVTVREDKKTLALASQVDRPLPMIHVIHGEKVVVVRNLQPREVRTLDLASVSGRDLTRFVKDNGSDFLGAVRSRKRSLGDTRSGQLTEPEVKTVAASFPSLLQNSQVRDHQSLIYQPHLDLSSNARRGDTIVFIWDPQQRAMGPLNQFEVKRNRVDTCYRISVPVSL